MVTPTDIKRYLSQCYNISKRLRDLNEQIAEYRIKAMKQTYAWSDTPSGGHASASPQSVYIEKSLSKLREMVKDREAWHAAVHGAQRVRHN